MPTSTLDVLRAIKTAAMTVDGVDTDTCRIGKHRPPRAGMGIVIDIIPTHEPGDWKDDDETERTLTIVLCASIRIDESQDGSQVEQLIGTFEEAHDAVEALARSNCNGLVDMFREDESGKEWDNFDDGDLVAFAGSMWKATWHRPLAGGA